MSDLQLPNGFMPLDPTVRGILLEQGYRELGLPGEAEKELQQLSYDPSDNGPKRFCRAYYLEYPQMDIFGWYKPFPAAALEP